MSATGWNPSDVGTGYTVSESDVRAASANGSWMGARSEVAGLVTSSVGRYAEFYCVSLADYCMVGLTSPTISLTAGTIHSDAVSAVHWSNGSIYPGGSGFGSAWTTGDRIMVAMRNGKVYFGKNGTWFNSADFTAETGFAFSGKTGTKHLVMYAYTAGMRIYTRVADQSYSPPTGFVGFANPVTLTRTLLDADLNPLASTSFDWAFFDNNTIGTLLAPAATGTASTDGSGVLSITIPNCGLASGGVGSLLISNTAGSATTQCRSHFAPIEIP